MSRDDSNKNLFSISNRIILWMTNFLGLMALIGSSIKWFQDSTLSSVVIIFMVLGSILLFLGSGYIYFSKVIIGKDMGIPEKYPAYSQRVRRRALAVFIVFPVLFFFGIGYWIYDINRPPDKILTLIAKFGGENHVAENILNELNNTIIEKYDDVKVEILEEDIKTQENARHIVDKHKASILLYGWCDSGNMSAITAFFELKRKEINKFVESSFETLKISLHPSDNVRVNFIQLRDQASRNLSFLTVFAIGLIRYEAKDYEDAILMFTDALSRYSVLKEMDNPEMIHQYRGAAYFHNGKIDQAINDCSIAIGFNPNFEAYNIRGNLYLNNGNFNEAIADYTQAIELKPDSEMAYNNRAVCYERINKIDKAINDYNEAISLNDKSPVPYLNRGNAYNEKNKFTQAIVDYTEAIKRNSKYSKAYNYRGRSYLKLHEFDKAIDDFNKAIKLKDDYFEAYLNRGIAHNSLSQFKEAKKDYETALRLDKDSFFGQSNLAWTLFDLGDYEEALKHWEKINLKEVNTFTKRQKKILNTDKLVGMAIALYRTDKPEDAEKYIESALNLYGSSLSCKVLQSEFFWKESRCNELEPTLRNLLNKQDLKKKNTNHEY